MKKICLIFLIFILGIWGCSDSVGPFDDSVEAGINAVQIQNQNLSENLNLLGMPSPKNKSLAKTFFIVEKLVTKSGSTKLELKDEYEGGVHGKVKFKIALEFKEDCVEEDVNISMSFDLETGIITVLPHMVLKKPAELEIYQEGHDLKEGDEQRIKFIHLNDDGTYYELNNKKVQVYIEKGAVKVMKCEADQFSRFTGLF